VLRFLADASLRGVYVRALRRAFPEMALVTAHDAGLRDAPDAVILQRAADEGRIVISQDFATMPDFALARVAAGLPMPGVIQVPLHGPVAPVIEDFRLILAASIPDDWRDQVVYLPLKR
jgi:predicted nuclease of predicted toxin-antitoxin system